MRGPVYAGEERRNSKQEATDDTCLSVMAQPWMPQRVHNLAARPNSVGEDEPAVAGNAPPRSTESEEGGLAAISTTINDHLRLFRAGMATMVVGSALTISFLVYRRGMHGFRSAAEVPASYYKRRKRLRVRVAKVVEAPAPPPKRESVDEGDGRFVIDGKQTPTSALRDSIPGGRGDKKRLLWGSDFLLHVEHITLLRRVLRLPPRSLLPGTRGSDVATFTVRLCGVSAHKEGIKLARQELVNPLTGCYCDAELLFCDPRPMENSGALSFDSGVGESDQASHPVAVCHIHRRRGVLWRDILLSPIDPKAGFGEYLLSEGLAKYREEFWWAQGPKNPTNEAATNRAHDDANATTGTKKPPSLGLKDLLDDRERFVAAEKSAEQARRGLWALLQDGEDRENATEAKGKDGGARRGLKERSARIVRAVMTMFNRRL